MWQDQWDSNTLPLDLNKGGATININKNHADFDLNDDLGFEAADLVLDTAIVFPVTNTPSEAISTQKWASVSSQFDFEIFTCYR